MPLKAAKHAKRDNNNVADRKEPQRLLTDSDHQGFADVANPATLCTGPNGPISPDLYTAVVENVCNWLCGLVDENA